VTGRERDTTAFFSKCRRCCFAVVVVPSTLVMQPRLSCRANSSPQDHYRPHAQPGSGVGSLGPMELLNLAELLLRDVHVVQAPRAALCAGSAMPRLLTTSTVHGPR